LIQFYIGIASNKLYDESIRLMALSFLMWCTVYKVQKLLKLKLIGPLISSILPIAIENSADETTDESSSDDCPSKLALQVISSLSTNLPPSHVFPEVMQHIVLFMQQADPKYRKAGMLALSVVVDGCADFMRSRTTEYFPLLCHGLQDPDLTVRKASCIALGSLAGIFTKMNCRCLG
jgi:hypothetical protein